MKLIQWIGRPFLLTAAAVSGSNAADICKAIAVRDVPAIGHPTSIIKRGDYDDAITQFRVYKNTSIPWDTSFCSHNGFCYPTHIVENGSKVDALRLTNCKIGKRTAEDSDTVFYDVDVIKSKAR